MVLSWADAAAVEQQAERAEDLLDLGVAAGALERDHVAVCERLVLCVARRGAQRDELLAQQAGLADLGDRVVGQLDVVAQLAASRRRA